MCTDADVRCKMYGAAFRVKRPALPVMASVSITSKPRKLSRTTALAKNKPPPQDSPLRPMHPSGVVIDIVGTNRSDRGRSCDDHPDGCGAAVLNDDVVIRIKKEQILVEDFLLGKGKMREETALTINWVSDGVDRCRVGFLPKAYVPHAKLWDGVLCQVAFVGTADDPSSIVRKKCHHYCGYVRAAVISALPCSVKVFDDRYELMMD
jgi:hypothetical protein